jgi:hypothetical protein
MGDSSSLGKLVPAAGAELRSCSATVHSSVRQVVPSMTSQRPISQYGKLIAMSANPSRLALLVIDVQRGLTPKAGEGETTLGARTTSRA